MRLIFYVQGEGLPLIVIHGLLGSSDNWRAMSIRFAVDRALIYNQDDWLAMWHVDQALAQRSSSAG